MLVEEHFDISTEAKCQFWQFHLWLAVMVKKLKLMFSKGYDALADARLTRRSNPNTEEYSANAEPMLTMLIQY